MVFTHRQLIFTSLKELSTPYSIFCLYVVKLNTTISSLDIEIIVMGDLGMMGEIMGVDNLKQSEDNVIIEGNGMEIISKNLNLSHFYPKNQVFVLEYAIFS